MRAQLDTRQLEADLKKFSKDLNKTAEETITEMAQIGGRQLAIAAEPRGLQKEKSESLVYKDFYKSYDYLGQTYEKLKQIDQAIAIAFAKAAKAGDFRAAEKYAQKYLGGYRFLSSDDGSHQQKQRNNKGRVKDNAPQVGMLDNSVLDDVRNKLAKDIGFVKAAFLQAAKSIGSKTRIPSWLNKSKQYGSSSKQSSDWGFSVILKSNVAYTTNVLSPTKINRAVKQAYKNQVKKMKRQLDALAAKF